jgi:hypothetical protein
MASEMMRPDKDGLRPSRADRQTQALAKKLINEVRIAALKTDGALALGDHIMTEIVELDDHRHALGRDNLALNLVLAEIEATAISQCKGIQRGLFNRWGV